MTTFRITHISDLHFSENVSAGSSYTHSIPHLILLQHIIGQQQQQKPFDRLIVTGDISNLGDKESLLKARDWLLSDFSVDGHVRTGLNLPPDALKVVPGNHDAYGYNPARLAPVS